MADMTMVYINENNKLKQKIKEHEGEKQELRRELEESNSYVNQAIAYSEEVNKRNQELEIEVVRLQTQLDSGAPCSCSDKVSEYQQQIMELQHEINILNEKIHQEKQKCEETKIRAHTRVINALNDAFDDYY